MKASEEETRSRLGSLDDFRLQEMLVLRRGEYTPKAFELAREELARRGLKELSLEEFHSSFNVPRITPSGFCERCIEETVPGSPGNLFSINWAFGTTLTGSSEPCYWCGSVIKRKAALFFVIPFPSKERYRVLYTKQGVFTDHFVTRLLKDSGGRGPDEQKLTDRK